MEIKKRITILQFVKGEGYKKVFAQTADNLKIHQYDIIDNETFIFLD